MDIVVTAVTNDEAKFILAAYRPGGRDANDPLFAAVLIRAYRDPQLRAWFQSQHGFDAAVSAKLRELQPPPGLRDALLVGARVSCPMASPSRFRRWLRRLRTRFRSGRSSN